MANKTKIPAWYDVLPMVLNLCHRILLFGPPDTGKTTTAARLGKSYRLQCSRQQGIEDLLGSFILNEGRTEFVPGPIPRAMSEGCTLLVDEFDLRNPAHDSIWHSVLDERDIATVRLPDGTEVKPAEGFRVICTTNSTPHSFSPALQRRFELKLFCGQAHPEAIKTLPPHCGSMLRNWQKSVVMPEVKVETSMSSLRVFSRLAAADDIGQDLAAILVFPSTHAEFLSALASNMKA